MSIYDRINQLQGGLPWGSVLDAGTGGASLRWLLSIDSECWTAVTGSRLMAERVRTEAGEGLREQDRIVLGNWVDPGLLQGERFDHVLADYLLGALDAFAPYWQDQLFARLRPLTGRRLYLVGLEPYVPFRSDDATGTMVGAIGRLRDACLLLSGERPYREYPMDWVLRSLEQSGFRVVDAERHPIRYGPGFIDSQLDLCTRELNKLPDRNLAVALQQHVAALRLQAQGLCRSLEGLRHGYDYIVVAEPR